MLEQVIRKQNNSNDRFWKKVFQALQVISIVILLFCVWFGYSVNSYYWDVDRALFWRACFALLLLSLPLFCFVLVMRHLTHKLGLEYDYELFEDNMEIFRLLGSSRKRYLSFDLNKITYFRDVISIRPGSPDEKLLHSAKSASCNPDAPHLVLIQADCVYKRTAKKEYILLELNDIFYETLCKKLETFRFGPQN